MTQEELRGLTKEEISRRIREGVKAVIEQVLEEEMTAFTPSRIRLLISSLVNPRSSSCVI